ncbi:MAG: ABC transporter substrate-binding protein [Actinomycetia bacterium]|nr:ABC transporter substrate-binding protein [Actinomycetes bacterium]
MGKHEITRRNFVAGAAVAGAAAAGAGLLTGCQAGGSANTTTDGGGAASEKKTGGTFEYYINEPAYIDPYNLKESEGTMVSSCLFDSLLSYDYRTQQLVPAAAESYEASADATVFTFHLRRGAKFHNGDPVDATAFKRGWERICNPNISKAPSEISYHLAQIKGYKEMFEDKKATSLAGVKAVDALTLEVTLTAAYADFPYILSHPALGPVPAAAKDFDSFTEAPIGNGPFMIDDTWKHDQYIRLKRFEDYYDQKAYIDGIDFNIVAKVDTAYTEFQAGNLDFAMIPKGQIEAALAAYGESEDGYTSQPGKQTLLGPESSVYYLVINNTDPVMENQKLREAISYAVNRQAICTAIFQDTRVPADGLIPPGIKGYHAGAWAASYYDIEKAKQALAEAGFPNGEGLAPIKLSYNTGGDHESIMQMIQSDLHAIGIEAELEALEWARYLGALAEGKVQIGRLAWVADYPIMENFLYSLFYTNNGDNLSKYSNPEVDKQIMAARGVLDDDARIAAFQKVDELIQSTTPIVPIMFYKHNRVCSERVNDFYFSPNIIPDMVNTWLSA